MYTVNAKVIKENVRIPMCSPIYISKRVSFLLIPEMYLKLYYLFLSSKKIIICNIKLYFLSLVLFLGAKAPIGIASVSK